MYCCAQANREDYKRDQTTSVKVTAFDNNEMSRFNINSFTKLQFSVFLSDSFSFPKLFQRLCESLTSSMPCHDIALSRKCSLHAYYLSLSLRHHQIKHFSEYYCLAEKKFQTDKPKMTLRFIHSALSALSFVLQLISS